MRRRPVGWFRLDRADTGHVLPPSDWLRARRVVAQQGREALGQRGPSAEAEVPPVPRNVQSEPPQLELTLALGGDDRRGVRAVVVLQRAIGLVCGPMERPQSVDAVDRTLLPTQALQTGIGRSNSMQVNRPSVSRADS